jgi:tRNA/rRNA methyltransferase
VRVNLANIVIVLCRPRYPENIGSAARAMRNMGIRRLVVVQPEFYDRARILKLATHVAADVVAHLELFDELQPALASCNYVVGTTARLGGQRRLIRSPDKLADHLIPISQDNTVALLFGPEDRGLSNEDLRLCHALATIPTADFSSLNLAQAVMVMCYELFRAGADEVQEATPRLASRHELDGMYAQVKELLVRINYIQPDNPDYWMNKIRHWLSRLPLRAGEVSIIRGICRQIDWYAGKCFADGRNPSALPPGVRKQKALVYDDLRGRGGS